MKEIYKSSLLLIHSVTQLNGICNKFSVSPTDENGNKIVEIVDKCEEKFLKVKEEIVKMVKEIETKKNQSEEHEIAVEETLGGYLVRKSKEKE